MSSIEKSSGTQDKLQDKDKLIGTFEALLIGKNFNATLAAKINARIVDCLGLDKTTAPDFCTDEDACMKVIATLPNQFYVKPTLKGKVVCIFDHNSGVVVTIPFSSDVHALVTALVYVLHEDKSLLT